MKTSRIIQTMLLVSALLLSLVFVPTSAQAAKKDMPAVYIMYFETETQYITISGAYVADEDGNTYFVTIWEAEDLIDQGFQPTVISGDFEAPAEFVTRKGNFAFFDVPDLKGATPLTLSDNMTAVSYLWLLNEDGSLDEDRFELDDDWVEDNGFLYNPDMECPDVECWGAPILNKNMDGVGMLYSTEDAESCIVLYSSISFPSSAIISGNRTGSDGNGSDGSDSGSSGSGKSGSSSDDGGFPSWIIWTLLGLGAAAAIGFFGKKKNSGENGTQAVETGAMTMGEGTICLDPEEEIPMAPVISQNSQWQIRGMGGTMDGRIFLVTSPMKLGRRPDCDVVFDQSAAGVSGEHCQLSIENGRVILRDLQSSYGTYLSRKIRLEPQVDYHLQLGDEFTLAEGGQTFRLEKAGFDQQGSGPAVKGISGDRVYTADIQGRIQFGRDAKCQVVFDPNDGGISAVHCTLYRENGGLFLVDHGSSNGTFFDGGQRLKPNVPYPVRKGQSFYLTAYKNTFVITED